MKNHARTASVLAIVSIAGLARADIIGFGDYATDWRFQRLDSAAAFTPSGNGIQLSAANGGRQFRNYYNVNRQDVTRFVASFTYQATPTNVFNAFDSGLTFSLFTSATSANGTASGGNSGFWGYANDGGLPANQNLLNPSVSLVLALPTSTFTDSSGAGFYSNAAVGGNPASTGLVSLGANHPVNVTVRYGQAGDLANFMYLTLADTVTGAVYSPPPTFMPVVPTLGASTAFVGFTTQARGSDQFITNFSFVSVPTPGGALLLTGGGLVAMRRRR